jgi:ribokinase
VDKSLPFSYSVCNSGQNIIVIVPGANKTITPEYIMEHGEQFIKKAKVVIVQLEIPIDSTHTALKLAKKYGAISIFNTAPGSESIPKELFSLTDILCLNETEVRNIFAAAFYLFTLLLYRRNL